MKKFKNLVGWESSLVIFLIIEIIVFGLINSRFLNPNVLIYSINDFVCISIISIFLTLVIITGGMDISSGSIIGLSSVTVGILWKVVGLNIWGAILVTILLGAVCGALNGFLVSYTGVQPMVVTLGTSMLFSGVALVIIGLSGVSAFEGISGFPDAFIQIANGNILGVPNPVIIFIVLAIIAFIILHKTNFGRYVFLVGINKNTARYSGINDKLITMFTYILTGTSAAIAGIVMTSYLGSSRPELGAELTLPIITAVVLGGTAITGGRGSIIGTALASLIVGFMTFGLQMSGISSQYISVGTGLLLIITIAIREEQFIKEFIRKRIREKQKV
ncbi:MAG: ABC transporter permease subunit [Sarcina sp.]